MKPCRCRNQDCSTRGVHDRLVRRGTRRWLAPHRISLRLGARASRPHPDYCQGVLPCLRTIDASGKRKGSNGPVPGRSKWGRQPKLCQAWCGRDARAPRKPSFHEIATPKGQKRRRILAPLVVEGGPSVFRSIGVYSCPFVVRLHFQVGFLRSRRPDIPPHPVPAKASSRARACRLSTLQAAGSVRRLAAAELQCDSAGSYLVAPHRISLRLAARLLRLPLTGGVIGVVAIIVLHATVGASLVGAQSGNHRATTTWATTRVAPTLGGYGVNHVRLAQDCCRWP